MLERTDHQLCTPELMAAKLTATAPNGSSCGKHNPNPPYLETPTPIALAG